MAFFVEFWAIKKERDGGGRVSSEGDCGRLGRMLPLIVPLVMWGRNRAISTVSRIALSTRNKHNA